MCSDCNSTTLPSSVEGDNGWSPVLSAVSVECEGVSQVLQLISWIGGTGTKPFYNSNEMTDAWLLVNPIYIGSTGFVTNPCLGSNIKGDKGDTGDTGAEGPKGDTGDQGEVGPMGPQGCAPILTITGELEDGEETFPVEVEGPIIEIGEPCAASYNFIFPLTPFQDYINSTVNTAVNNILNSPWYSRTYNGSQAAPGNSTNQFFDLIAYLTPPLGGTLTTIKTLAIPIYGTITSTVDFLYKQLGNSIILNFNFNLYCRNTDDVNRITYTEIRIDLFQFISSLSAGYNGLISLNTFKDAFDGSGNPNYYLTAPRDGGNVCYTSGSTYLVLNGANAKNSGIPIYSSNAIDTPPTQVGAGINFIRATGMIIFPGTLRSNPPSLP
jgi:hypothetical protein